MIQVLSDPTLLDFIKVCAQMPSDERAQVEAFVGEAYSVDGAAVGNFTAPGAKWVIVSDNEPIVIGGFVPQRPGVWRDFLLTTPGAWERHWYPVTRICRRVMNAMFISGQAHRLECIVPAERTEARPELVKWYKVMGYKQEAILHGYCANGADAVCFSRVGH